VTSGVTPFQTVGPYFAVALRTRTKSVQLGEGAAGTRIVIEGTVVDGQGAVMPDAVIEIWQADARGRYRHPEDTRPQAPDPAFNGYGWAHTRKDGGFTFETVKPGRVPGPVPGSDGREQAPHVLVSVMARGILNRYVTRLYFEDEPANATDPILALVPADRRQTLIASRAGNDTYRFDIVMQGPKETVFFDV
jgi:protocatechuate 3,4-dioxygenase alpha subunit